jgi:redox-sensitive bicupin YhaK (pirin superfamily)
MENSTTILLCFRGFETVSYLLEGEFTHEDFAGNKVT